MDFDFNNSEEEKNTESYKRDTAIAEIMLEICTRLVETEHRIDELSQRQDELSQRQYELVKAIGSLL